MPIVALLGITIVAVPVPFASVVTVASSVPVVLFHRISTLSPAPKPLAVTGRLCPAPLVFEAGVSDPVTLNVAEAVRPVPRPRAMIEWLPAFAFGKEIVTLKLPLLAAVAVPRTVLVVDST